MSWIITDLLLALFGLVASIFIVLTIVGVGNRNEFHYDLEGFLDLEIIY